MDGILYMATALIFAVMGCRFYNRVSKKYDKKNPFLMASVSVIWGIISLFYIIKFNISIVNLKNYIFLCVLCYVSLTDLFLQMIPDRVLLFGVVVWCGFLVFEDQPLLTAKMGFLSALLIGCFLLFFILLCDRLLHKDTMGGGDIKLVTLIGLYLGYQSCLLCFIISCFLCICMAGIQRIMRKRKWYVIPMAPALCLATVSVL